MESLFIFVDMDEHLARIYDVAPGLNYLDCTGDSRLKSIYMYQKLSTDDIAAWLDGVVTDHAWELLEDIGADVTNVRIEYCRENRRYEIEVAERIEVCIPEFSVQLEID